MAKKKANDCPLFLHQNGQWAKKVRQKLYYFGSDKDVALKRWHDEKDAIFAGRPVRRNDPNPAIVELGNLFIANRRQKVDAGSIEARTVDDYEETIRRLIGIVGKDCRPHELRPLDYALIKARLALSVRDGVHGKPTPTDTRGKDKEEKENPERGRQVERRSQGSVGGDIRRLRVFLNWCWKAELVPNPPRYGDEFSPASRKEQRRRRAREGRKDFSAEQVHAILAKCRPAMRAMVLFALNGGVGNLDVAGLTFDRLGDIDAAEPLVNYPRNKTGAPRRFFLWPETAEAIRDYLADRPEPRSEAYSETVFLTRLRHPWIRKSGSIITDSISFEFTKARKAAGLDRGSFYDLRRTFRTVAAGVRDREAIDLVMGHADDADDMAAVYVQHVDDDRIRAVCNHVRQWLFEAEQVSQGEDAAASNGDATDAA